MANSTSSYQAEDLGGGRTRFIVTAAASRKPIGRAIILGVIGWGGGGALIGGWHSLFSYFGAIAGAYAGFVLLRKFALAADAKKRGNGGSFVASANGVELSSGKVINTDLIHRLILRNAFSDLDVPYVGGTTVVAGTSGMAMAGAAGAAYAQGLAAVAQADIRRGTLIGYKLDVEFGGNAVTLASGMTETTAYGLMQDVGKILGLAP